MQNKQVLWLSRETMKGEKTKHSKIKVLYLAKRVVVAEFLFLDNQGLPNGVQIVHHNIGLGDLHEVVALLSPVSKEYQKRITLCEEVHIEQFLPLPLEEKSLVLAV